MTKKSLILLLLISISCLITISPLYGDFNSADFNKTSRPLKITRISPSGRDIPPGRQIVFKFNMAVVPVGRMERTPEEIPITITPELKGQWRWLNTSSLALQLGDRERMKFSTKYTIRIEPTFVAYSGGRMEEGLTHTLKQKGDGHEIMRFSFCIKRVKKGSGVCWEVGSALEKGQI